MTPMMDRIRRFFLGKGDATRYEPLADRDGEPPQPRPSSSGVDRLEYAVFVLMGIAMLWSWNMFLAAAPYFQTRFAKSAYLLQHFQSSIITVSTVSNLASVGVLTKLQARASYPKRIMSALTINIASFITLALLTVTFLDIQPEAYFALLLLIVFCASVATGLIQNGIFAFAASFGPGEYIQAIMLGQGVAGVAPCVVQIVSVLSVPASRDGGAVQESPRSACAYFGTAAVVSVAALVAFAWLLRRTPPAGRKSRAYAAVAAAAAADGPEATDAATADQLSSSQISLRKVVGLGQLFLKLRWLAMAVFVTFAVTMQFAVYTQKILSVRDPRSASRIFEPAAFIPLGYLFWNMGDLIGRMAAAVPVLNTADKPVLLFLIACARLLFIPLYHLCNIGGRGAVVSSDFFYLFVVQVPFGFTNGWLGSLCMVGAPDAVEEDERAAAGAFMGLVLIAGLSVGSIVSFAAA